MTLLSFHGDPAIKAKYLKRVERHAELDEIIQGTYWEHGKGCAVGCTIHSGDHDYYESELGLPAWLARLEDAIFEGLPNVEAKSFPAAFLAAIRPGSDLTPVRHRFLAFLMRENLDRVEALELDSDLKSQVTEAIQAVLELHVQASADPAAWLAARSAAAAARSLAWLAVDSVALSAARSVASAQAAWSAEVAAVESVALSAAWLAGLAAGLEAVEAAEAAAYVRYRDELLRLLVEA